MDVTDIIKKEVYNTQVLILAGGKGKRMGLSDIPKPLIKVAGETLLERCIKFHKLNGFHKFLLLVGHKHEMIQECLGDGSRLDVEVDYSIDPQNVGKVGKGKAIKHALLQGKIDRKKRVLISYPDDIFLDPTLPTKLLLHHVQAVEDKGIKATVVFTTAVEYPYGVGEVDENGLVRKFEEKPVIRFLTSCGMYMLEPDVFDLIEERVDMETEEAIEFESIILPELASRKQLYAFTIPKGVWIPVNTQKEWELAERLLSKKKLPY